MELWQTSIDELLANFQGAILSLLPWMKGSRIPCREGEAYDQWDNIATAIFEAIVQENLEFATNVHKNDLALARYDSQYESYEGLNFIILDEEIYEDFYVFESFDVDDSLQVVKICIVDRRTLRVKSRMKTRYQGRRFQFYKDTKLYSDLVIV
jgi:hypothetical protein